MLFIAANNAARTVVVKHGTGNIQTWDGNDINLDEARKVLQAIYDGTNWNVISVISAASSSADIIHLQDQKTSGTGGGTPTASSWTVHDLNTEVSDVGGHCTLSSNQFTLASGTYEYEAKTLYHSGTSTTRIRLYNATDTAVVDIAGMNGNGISGNGSNEVSVRGRFTIAASKAIELYYYQTAAANGLGVASSLGTEVYADVWLRKVG